MIRPNNLSPMNGGPMKKIGPIAAAICVLVSVFGCSSMQVVDRPPNRFEVRINPTAASDPAEDLLEMFSIAAEKTIQMGYSAFYMWYLGTEENASHGNATLITTDRMMDENIIPVTDETHLFLFEPVNEPTYDEEPYSVDAVLRVIARMKGG